MAQSEIELGTSYTPYQLNRAITLNRVLTSIGSFEKIRVARHDEDYYLELSDRPDGRENESLLVNEQTIRGAKRIAFSLYMDLRKTGLLGAETARGIVAERQVA